MQVARNALGRLDVGARLLRKVDSAVATKSGLWRGDRALDLASAGGRVGTVLASRFATGRFVMVDEDPENLASCRKDAAEAGVGGRLGVMRCRLDRLPFADETFQCVATSFFASGVALDAFESAIEEAARVLWPWGKFVAIDVDWGEGRSPDGKGTNLFDERVRARFEAAGFGKIHTQRLAMLPDGLSLKLLTGKLVFDAGD
ncbi:MAG: class I SAM-dependent methyltransferase [Methanobacteriota archaeon]